MSSRPPQLELPVPKTPNAKRAPGSILSPTGAEVRSVSGSPAPPTPRSGQPPVSFAPSPSPSPGAVAGGAGSPASSRAPTGAKARRLAREAEERAAKEAAEKQANVQSYNELLKQLLSKEIAAREGQEALVASLTAEYAAFKSTELESLRSAHAAALAAQHDSLTAQFRTTMETELEARVAERVAKARLEETVRSNNLAEVQRKLHVEFEDKYAQRLQRVEREKKELLDRLASTQAKLDAVSLELKESHRTVAHRDGLVRGLEHRVATLEKLKWHLRSYKNLVRYMSCRVFVNTVRLKRNLRGVFESLQQLSQQLAQMEEYDRSGGILPQHELAGWLDKVRKMVARPPKPAPAVTSIIGGLHSSTAAGGADSILESAAAVAAAAVDASLAPFPHLSLALYSPPLKPGARFGLAVDAATSAAATMQQAAVENLSSGSSSAAAPRAPSSSSSSGSGDTSMRSPRSRRRVSALDGNYHRRSSTFGGGGSELNVPPPPLPTRDAHGDPIGGYASPLQFTSMLSALGEVESILRPILLGWMSRMAEWKAACEDFFLRNQELVGENTELRGENRRQSGEIDALQAAIGVLQRAVGSNVLEGKNFGGLGMELFLGQSVSRRASLGSGTHSGRHTWAPSAHQHQQGGQQHRRGSSFEQMANSLSRRGSAGGMEIMVSGPTSGGGRRSVNPNRLSPTGATAFSPGGTPTSPPAPSSSSGQHARSSSGGSSGGGSDSKSSEVKGIEQALSLLEHHKRANYLASVSGSSLADITRLSAMDLAELARRDPGLKAPLALPPGAGGSGSSAEGKKMPLFHFDPHTLMQCCLGQKRELERMRRAMKELKAQNAALGQDKQQQLQHQQHGGIKEQQEEEDEAERREEEGERRRRRRGQGGSHDDSEHGTNDRNGSRHPITGAGTLGQLRLTAGSGEEKESLSRSAAHFSSSFASPYASAPPHPPATAQSTPLRPSQLWVDESPDRFIRPLIPFSPPVGPVSPWMPSPAAPSSSASSAAGAAATITITTTTTTVATAGQLASGVYGRGRAGSAASGQKHGHYSFLLPSPSRTGRRDASGVVVPLPLAQTQPITTSSSSYASTHVYAPATARAAAPPPRSTTMHARAGRARSGSSTSRRGATHVAPRSQDDSVSTTPVQSARTLHPLSQVPAVSGVAPTTGNLRYDVISPYVATSLPWEKRPFPAHATDAPVTTATASERRRHRSPAQQQKPSAKAPLERATSHDWERKAPAPQAMVERPLQTPQQPRQQIEAPATSMAATPPTSSNPAALRSGSAARARLLLSVNGGSGGAAASATTSSVSPASPAAPVSASSSRALSPASADGRASSTPSRSPMRSPLDAPAAFAATGTSSAFPFPASASADTPVPAVLAPSPPLSSLAVASPSSRPASSSHSRAVEDASSGSRPASAAPSAVDAPSLPLVAPEHAVAVPDASLPASQPDLSLQVLRAQRRSNHQVSFSMPAFDATLRPAEAQSNTTPSPSLPSRPLPASHTHADEAELHTAPSAAGADGAGVALDG